MTAAVKDLNDNTLGSDFTWQFTTNAAIDIQVVLAIPEATEMNFAALEVGATSTYQMVTVTSTGSETLHISELSLAGDDANCFKLENNLCNAAALVPGDSCTTRVLFNPQSAGNKLCELRISSDADDSSTVIVSLSGTATETIPHSDDGDDSGSGGGGGRGLFYFFDIPEIISMAGPFKRDRPVTILKNYCRLQ